MASIYWAFTTMTTVGYGDLIVTTTLERAFCVFGMVVGATVFGYIVGNVSVMMESFDVQSALQTQKMDRVKVNIQYLTVHGCGGLMMYAWRFFVSAGQQLPAECRTNQESCWRGVI